jgi:hypothetical protein
VTAISLPPGWTGPAAPTGPDGVPGDRRRLLFTCCHPALALEAGVARWRRAPGADLLRRPDRRRRPPRRTGRRSSWPPPVRDYLRRRLAEVTA